MRYITLQFSIQMYAYLSILFSFVFLICDVCGSVYLPHYSVVCKMEHDTHTHYHRVKL